MKVLYKLKKGLESENADMNRDVESEYREILKWVQLEKSRMLQRLGITQNNLKIIRSVMRPNQEGDGGQEAVRWQCAEDRPEVSKAGAPHSGEGVDRERNAKSQKPNAKYRRTSIFQIGVYTEGKMPKWWITNIMNKPVNYSTSSIGQYSPQSGGQSQIQDDEDLAVTEDEVRRPQSGMLFFPRIDFCW